LAESVAAVVEIKSDLSSQWDEVERTVRKVKPLSRDLRQTQGLLLESSPEPDTRISRIQGIACYVIGFRGYSGTTALERRLTQTEPNARPDGALVIEAGAFVGVTGNADGEEGIYRLIAELAEVFNAARGVAYPRFTNYVQP
jgi:hypothetical protein